MYIIYNCGYRSQTGLRGRYTGKKYIFRKRFVTKVQNDDGKHLLQMTSKDIPWCSINSRNIPPFMKLEDWCAGKEGRFDRKPYRIYKAKEYLEAFLLK